MTCRGGWPRQAGSLVTDQCGVQIIRREKFSIKICFFDIVLFPAFAYNIVARRFTVCGMETLFIQTRFTMYGRETLFTSLRCEPEAFFGKTSFDGLIGDSLELRNCALKYNSGHSARAYSRVENRIKNEKGLAPNLQKKFYLKQRTNNSIIL